MNGLFVQNLLAKQLVSFFFAFTVLISTAVPVFLAQPKETEAWAFICSNCTNQWWDDLKWAVEKVWEAAMEVYSAVTAGGITALVTKEYILDGISWFLNKVVLRSITHSLVQWINSGFQGEPAWILDKSVLLSVVVDENVAFLIGIIMALSDEELYPWFKAAIVQAIGGSIYAGFEEGLQSTFPGGMVYYNDYLNDFSACPAITSWECYISISYYANNPYGIVDYALGHLSDMIAEKVGNVTNDLLEGTGFLSFSECVKYGPRTNFVEEEPPCIERERRTPGQVLANQMTSGLNTSKDSLIQADELEEAIIAIIDALIDQLINQGLYFLSGVEEKDYGYGGTPGLPTFPQCSNGIDDDGDGEADQNDAGCWSGGGNKILGSYVPNRNSESEFDSECNDGTNNDGVGGTDQDDANCHANGNPNDITSYRPGGFSGDNSPGNPDNPNGEEKTNPACNDGADNDGDGEADEEDRWCHQGGDLSNPYTPNRDSESAP